MVIEKHFTHNKKGNDHYHSADLKDLKKLNENFEQVLASMKDNIKKKIKTESKSRINARRAIFTIKKINKNHRIRKEDIVCKRPATGLSPEYFDKLIGKKIKKSKKEDTPIYLRDF